MTIVSSSTIIAAPPSVVRATFLDWPNLTTWDKRYMKTLTPLLPDGSPDPSKTSGLSVAPGDRVHGTFWGGEANLEILENTESQMSWKENEIEGEGEGEGEGGKGLGKGRGTRFTQSEEATGFMGGVLVVDGWLGGNLKRKFAGFNEDLKGVCERDGKK